jgi:hypothetical protein
MKAFICLIFFAATSSVFSQTDEEMDSMAKSVCECITKKQVSFANRKEMEIALGLCMLEGIQELKLDLSITDGDGMEKFGQKIGIRMVGICPKIFESFINEKANESDQKEGGVEIKGTVKSVEINTSVTLVIRDDSGKESRLVWLHYANGSDDYVTEPKRLSGKKISATYKIVDIYSPKEKGYITVKEIIGFTVN